ncbi:riboflavin transporter RibU, partial [Staphylococcus aureus]|nr:riboflavin transporter RibU [Staphylococcus aureus]
KVIIVFGFIPFNIIYCIVFSIVFILLYRRLANFLKRI